MKLAVVDQHNKSVSEIAFADIAVVSKQTVTQALLHEQQNQRVAIAHTKDRGEVRGGGIKPWKQKGTGRARAGSSRSPLWRGGGITFGPRSNRNFATRLPKKMYVGALNSLLAHHIANGTIIVIDELVLREAKTKHAVTILDNLGISKNVLIVLDSIDQPLKRAFANIPGVSLCESTKLQLLDISRFSVILVNKAAAMQLFTEQKRKEDKVTEPKPIKPLKKVIKTQ